MEKEKTVNVDIIDLYRLLIGEMRYAYTRNNHLMPSGGYDEVKKYLDRMLEVDSKIALSTAAQLCDECISDQINRNFWSGLDDEQGNRQEAVDFVNYLMNWIRENADKDSFERYSAYKPYNYASFEANLEREKAFKYNLTIKTPKETITKESLTEIEANKEITAFLGVDSFVSRGTVTLHSKKEPNKVAGRVFTIESPEFLKDIKITIELCE